MQRSPFSGRTGAFVDYLIDDRGGSLIEYALIASLIAVAAFSSVALFGTHLRALYTDITNKVGSA